LLLGTLEDRVVPVEGVVVGVVVLESVVQVDQVKLTSSKIGKTRRLDLLGFFGAGRFCDTYIVRITGLSQIISDLT